MNLQDLQAFVAVAETGSVNRAAIRLNLTQPATTRRIQNFELAMGSVALFNRAVKPAVLTPLGQQALEHCRRVLAAVAELQACTAREADLAGDLRAGVAHGLGEMVLTTPLDALRRSFPGVRLQIGSDWTTGLVEAVRNGTLDCAVGLLTESHRVPPGVACVPLGSEQVVVAAAGPPAGRGGASWRLRDLAGLGWILNPPGCGCRSALVREHDRQHLPIRVAAEVFGEELQLSLLAHSGGLGLVPRRQLEASPHRGRLTILDVVDFTLPVTVALIRPAAPGRYDPALETLAAALQVELAPQRFA